MGARAWPRCPHLLPALLLLLLHHVTNLVEHCAHAAPAAPNYTSCAPPVDAPVTGIDCCTLPDLMVPGGPRNYITWQEYLRRNPLPARPRVRLAAHTAAANRTYLAQLHRAYQAMRDLPLSDPRSHYQQVNLHCMAGSEGMEMQVGFPAQEYSVHYTWFFLPYHRMFTFFYERILGKLVGDDTFTLPFWNWDNQLPLEPYLPNVIPHFYRDPVNYPALYNGNRDPRHQPGQPELLVDLDIDNVKKRIFTDDLDVLRANNNRRLHAYIARRGAHFLSRPLRAGDPLVIETDCFEIMVHGSVHYFMGHPDHAFLDMGRVFTAPHDPIFFAHHANVDRIWAIWQSMGGKDAIDDPDFMDAPFFFYDENAQLVRVTVADSIDYRPMMFEWQHVDNPWLTYGHSHHDDDAAAVTLAQPGAEADSTTADPSSGLLRRGLRSTASR